MTDDTHARATAAAADKAPRRGRHIFTVNAGRDMLEFEIDADDFEVAAEGVHFVIGQAGAVTAFVSHPCIVREDDDGTAAAARERS